MGPANPHEAAEPVAPADAVPADAAPTAPDPSDTVPADAERGPVIEAAEREVTLQRSVRYGRLLIGGAVLGAVVAAIASLLFPVEEGAEYTMAQAVGFFAVLGAAIGLCIGGVVALVLGLVARRQRGVGIAVQSDVR
ncbi:hypothetical protein EVS81_06765 [Leucobacter triazinivorans]|uniref:Potassium transporter Trk n=2 Tax=Leucobacter triazinivorans TaxID=1784719 RepID=A0A4P6KIA4_9MICO|nr:hypothetical protein EVS81_06765 [Leucobacter triazinivorans]